MPIYYKTGLESQAACDSELRHAESTAAASVRHFCENDLSQTGGTLGSVEGALVWSVTTHLTTPPTSIPISDARTYPRDIIDAAVRKYRRGTRPIDTSPLSKLSSERRIKFDELLRFEPNRAWRRLGKHEQDALRTRALIMDEASTSIAWTQNLSHGWISELGRPGVDPRKKHADELNRRSREIMGATFPMEFTFEADKNRRLHVHGVINLPVVDEITVSKFLEVLGRAGGYEGHQQAYLDLHTSPGWRNYYRKDLERTVAVLGTDKLSYSSQSLTKLARDAHETDRALRSEAKAM